jgi:hypothetical protein
MSCGTGNPYFTSTQPALQTQLNAWCSKSLVVGILTSQNIVNAIDTPELKSYFCKKSQPCKRSIVQRGIVQNATVNTISLQGYCNSGNKKDFACLTSSTCGTGKCTFPNYNIKKGDPVSITGGNTNIQTTVLDYNPSSHVVSTSSPFTVTPSSLINKTYLVGSNNPTPISSTCNIREYLDVTSLQKFNCICNPATCKTSSSGTQLPTSNYTQSSNLIYFIISIVLAVLIVILLIFVSKK